MRSDSASELPEGVNDNDHGTPGQKKGPFDNRFHRPRIKRDNPAKETGELGFFHSKKCGDIVARG